MSDQCRHIQEQIAAALDRDPSSIETDAVKEHLLECPACRDYQEGLLKDDQLLTEFVRSVDNSVSRLEGKIMDSIFIETRGAATASETERSSWFAVLFQTQFMKLAAAAAVVAGIILTWSIVDRPGGSNLVWAKVIKQVEEAEDFICRVTQDNTSDPDLDMVHYRSSKFGYRVEMYRRDSGELVAEQHIRPSKKTLYVLVHRDKSYALVELSDEQYEQMMISSNAKEMVEQFRSEDFEEIGETRINNITASGIEVKNPKALRSALDDSSIRLWVDVETNWPVKIEFDGTARGGSVRIHSVMDRFQWNPTLSREDFEFEIPDDYKMIGKMGAVEKDENSAIEGLREYSKFSGGRYPSSLTMATAIHEVEDDLGRWRRDGSLSQDAFGNLMKIQNTCAFFTELLDNKNDSAYYGGDVTKRDFDKVLMRWRLDSGKYRVVYGDLRTETVDAAQLAEMEKR